jgi:uncharacterized protein YukE
MHDEHADPVTLRARAAAVRESAQSLRALGERLDRRVEHLAFEGPAAVRFRAAASERARRTRHAVHELDAVADRLHQEATRAEQQADEARRMPGA